MASNRCEILVEISNADAVSAFTQATELLREAMEDMPWRDDLAEACGLLLKAARGFGVRRKDKR